MILFFILLKTLQNLSNNFVENLLIQIYLDKYFGWSQIITPIDGKKRKSLQNFKLKLLWSIKIKINNKLD